MGPLGRGTEVLPGGEKKYTIVVWLSAAGGATPMDFVAFDVETANSDFSSICQVGVVVFTGGKIVTKQSILVNPECSFDHRNVAIHGICAEDVSDAPPFAEVFPRLFG